MQKFPAEEILVMMMDCLISNLEESLEAEQEGDFTEFANGARNAYVEMMEMLQQWEKAEEYGLSWDVEGRFPV